MLLRIIMACMCLSAGPHPSVPCAGWLLQALLQSSLRRFSQDSAKSIAEDWAGWLGRMSSERMLRDLLNSSIFKTHEDTEESKRVLLLALFSSPGHWKGGRRIPQLALMKEISTCIEAIPRQKREIRPAAK